MSTEVKYTGGRVRHDFSKIRTAVRIPNLIEVQRQSYNRFLQMDLLTAERENIGLQAVFRSVFPISDFRATSTLDFVEYSIGNWQCKCGNLEGLNHLRALCRECGATIRVNPLSSDDVLCHNCGTFNKNVVNLCDNCGEPVGLKHKYDVSECRERGMTYSVPLKVKIRLTVYDTDGETGQRSIRDIKEEEVYFGDIPLMTDNGTFIINGTERVIVSQLHRSPGVFFEKSPVFLAKIIPYRGSWVEFEYDQKNLLYVRIDRKRKFLATIFLRALGLMEHLDLDSIGSDAELEDSIKKSGYSDGEIVRKFHSAEAVQIKGGRLFLQVSPAIVGMKFSYDITDSKSGDVIVKGGPLGKKVARKAFDEMNKAKIKEVEVAPEDFEGALFVEDVISDDEVVVDGNTEASIQQVSKLIESGIKSFEIYFPERDEAGVVISTTLRKDAIKAPAEALIEIYRKMRPGDPPTIMTAWHLFYGMFFDERKFDFSRVRTFEVQHQDGSRRT